MQSPFSSPLLSHFQLLMEAKSTLSRVLISDELRFELQMVAIFLLVMLSQLGVSLGNPRSRTVEVICATELEHNTTAYVPNFIAGMQAIADQVRATGFGLAVVGSGPDANYGLGQCHDDLSTVDCVLCYAEARTILPKCFPYRGGRIFLDGCFLRSDNYSFFHEFAGPEDKAVCGNTTRKTALFGRLAMNSLSEAAVKAPANGGFARASSMLSGSNESVHVLASCWKTLSAGDCRTCLADAAEMAAGCLPWSEGRALKTGCFLRFSDKDFLNPLLAHRHSKGIVLPVLFSVLSLLVLVGAAVAAGLLVRQRSKIQRKRRDSCDSENAKRSLWKSHLNFKYSTLDTATGSFSPENKLGQGGFGSVYKGVLPDGREIAVKRLYLSNRHRASDFYNEVNMVSDVEHKNLVRLLGCCCMGPESLLVYEFVPHKSLNLFLFDPEKGRLLDWDKRLEIMTGTAEGLAYLHGNSRVRIVHRDIKASNILLDTKFRPKIADFGLARSFQDDRSHISTAIAGTLGYMAPEYLALGQLTEKADVYSLGVLMIEIITGRSNRKSNDSDQSEGIITQVWKCFQLGAAGEMIDPRMRPEDEDRWTKVKEEAARAVQVALLCAQEMPSLRPSALGALRMLQKREGALPVPTRPPFTDESTMELGDLAADISTFSSDRHLGSVATVSETSFCPR
ncbi:cysteine-rich RLK (RECEPTOR-like protein kinase) 2 isoform X2 [Wolffia australiana]